jgi:hypothetical protein
VAGVEEVAGQQAGAASDLQDNAAAGADRFEEGEDAGCAVVGVEAEGAVVGGGDVGAVDRLFGGHEG